MASLKGKLALRDKRYYFAYSSPDYYHPKLVTHYWFVGNAVIGESEYDGADAYCDNGNVAFRMGDRLWSREQYMASKSADFTEVTPIPCPKVRKGIDTRYRDGRWEKCLKTGWAPA
jgi:hypothetical protein